MRNLSRRVRSVVGFLGEREPPVLGGTHALLDGVELCREVAQGNVIA
jgi:hypothetical protein